MNSRFFCMLVVSLAIWGCCSSVGSQRNRDCPRRPSQQQRESCNICFKRGKNVTLVVRNLMREPTFEDSVTLNCTHFMYLWDMLIEAADINPVFQFQATYSRSMGFFINAINKLVGTYEVDQTFWEILNGTDQQTSVGVSSYLPKNGETVTFNFTRGGH